MFGYQFMDNLILRCVIETKFYMSLPSTVVCLFSVTDTRNLELSIILQSILRKKILMIYFLGTIHYTATISSKKETLH